MAKPAEQTTWLASRAPILTQSHRVTLEKKGGATTCPESSAGSSGADATGHWLSTRPGVKRDASVRTDRPGEAL